MTINLKTIKHISKLSRISVNNQKADKLAEDLNSIFKFIEKLNELKTENVDDKKAKKLASDLNAIFDFIEKLNKLKTENVNPLTSVADKSLTLRSDEVKSNNIRDQIVKNSPQKNEDYFVVPKVIE